MPTQVHEHANPHRNGQHPVEFGGAMQFLVKPVLPSERLGNGVGARGGQDGYREQPGREEP